MRITTNMLMQNYQSSLMSNLNGLSEARNVALTGRKFTKASQDPNGAYTASLLERKYMRNKSYLKSITNVQSKQDAQEDAVRQLDKICQTISKDYSVSAMNDPSGEGGRETYATALRQFQHSMVTVLNSQYGGEFVMAGADGMNVPFVLTEDGGLTYRGIDVNTDDPAKLAQLEEFSKEHTYVDLGFGLSFQGATPTTIGEIVPSSAFDTSLPGINVVGFGKDSAGNSKNLIVLAGQMADELEKGTFDEDKYKQLWSQFDKQATTLTDTMTNLGTKTQLLESTKTRLQETDLALSEQIDGIVNVDPAEAFMNYSWANYTYMTALKVGTNILSSSLLDFMR